MAAGIARQAMRRGAAAALMLAGAAPAAAQTGDPPRIRILTPECEGAYGDEIVVCGRRERLRSRYRLPEMPDPGFDPAGDQASVSRERNALMEAGAGGIGSCSTVGPGGAWGCAGRDFARDIDQYGGDPPRMRNGYRRGRR